LTQDEQANIRGGVADSVALSYCVHSPFQSSIPVQDSILDFYRRQQQRAGVSVCVISAQNERRYAVL